MPEKRIEKPAEEEGKNPFLVTNERFAQFLVKEFPGEFERQPGKAKEIAFLYPQDKKEVMVLLKEWMPKAPFESIDGLLRDKLYDTIFKDLRILEEHRIPPSAWLLRIPPDTLEENIKILEENKIKTRVLLKADTACLKINIQLLKDLGRNPSEYARANRLGEEPKYFKEYLDKSEGAVIKELEEKMPKMPSKDIVDVVNKRLLSTITRRIEVLERMGVDLSTFTDIKGFADTLNSPLMELGRLSGATNNEGVVVYQSTKYERVTFYGFLHKGKFEETLKELKRNREQEYEAFVEIKTRIEKDGKISKDAIKEIFRKHAPAYIVNHFPEALDNRLTKVLKKFVDEGGLKKPWKEVVEKKEQLATKE